MADHEAVVSSNANTLAVHNDPRWPYPAHAGAIVASAEEAEAAAGAQVEVGPATEAEVGTAPGQDM
jgi:hypothetical protein